MSGGGNSLDALEETDAELGGSFASALDTENAKIGIAGGKGDEKIATRGGVEVGVREGNGVKIVIPHVVSNLL